jgi:hypothetical protein
MSREEREGQQIFAFVFSSRPSRDYSRFAFLRIDLEANAR